MHPLVRAFLLACKETPRGYFLPAVALWRVMRNACARSLEKRRES